MTEGNEQGHGLKGKDRMSGFSVTDLNILVEPGLSVSNSFTDEDPDKADLAVAADGIKFSATVTVPADEMAGTWHVGWIQTIYPCRQSVTYKNPSGPGLGNMVSTLSRAMADGDAAEDSGESHDGSDESQDGDETGGAEHWAWYEDPAECNAGGSVSVSMDDQPNVPFHTQYKGSNAPWIAGWHAMAVAGQKPFCTWLAAEAPDGEIVYLYHVAWTVDFGATLDSGKLTEATGGTLTRKKGEGKGDDEPCLESKTIADEDPPFLPDEELEKLKPA